MVNPKSFIVVGILLAAVLGGLFLIPGGTTSADTLDPDSYLRIHIRANSNDVRDQNVKYAVKDALTEKLTPLLADTHTKAQAIEVVKSHMDMVVSTAEEVLKSNGYNYGASAKISKEHFPVRSYDGFVLNSGEYDSLIVNLGTGSGNNWWCVVYPPLCFVNYSDSSTNVQYRSRLVEIIQKFFGG